MTLTIVRNNIREELAEIVYPIWRRIRRPTRLQLRLADYPPYIIPHPGSAYDLSKAQREENLAHFLAQKDERLKVITSLLAEFGMDAAPALDPKTDPLPFLEQLQQWALDEWEKLDGIERFTEDDYWINSKRDHSDIILSFLLDVAILLGEAVVVRRPDFAWALDDDRGSRQSQTTTWGRVVVFRPRNREKDYPWDSLDFEDIVIGGANYAAEKRFFRAAISNRWLHYTTIAAINGGYDPMW